MGAGTGGGGYLWSAGAKRRGLLSRLATTGAGDEAKDAGGGGGGGDQFVFPSIKAVPPPLTPREPMEFLSRSWSISASDLSRAFLANNSRKRTSLPPERDAALPALSLAVADADADGGARNSYDSTAVACRRRCPGPGSFKNRWFSSSAEPRKKRVAKKERERAERARAHAAVSVAGVAAAMSAVLAAENDPDARGPKMNEAVAAAAELLASHFIELAQQAGAGREKVAVAVQSAVDVRTPGDLLTLTAAAATALRAASALRQRVQREATGASVVAPTISYDRNHCPSPDVFCREGLLLKRTRKGQLHWKNVTIYINRSSQVLVKLKSKRGAFSKTKTRIVCGVSDNIPAWPGRPAGEGKAYFALKTTQGIVQFECDGDQKHKWVDGTRNLLQQAAAAAASPTVERSLGQLQLS